VLSGNKTRAFSALYYLPPLDLWICFWWWWWVVLVVGGATPAPPPLDPAKWWCMLHIF